MSSNENKFLWYDVMTTDTNAAEAFYKDVIGWGANNADVSGQEYTVFTAGSGGVAGLMPIPEDACAMGAKPGWMGYIWVADVDDYAERIKAAGGKIHRAPWDIPSVGRLAVAADPHGAPFLIMHPAGPPDALVAAPAGTLGHVGWHELHAGDMESAFAFYSGLFGWTKADAMDMGPMGTYQLFAVDGVPVGAMMTKTPDCPSPFWLYYFNVDGADAAVGRVTGGGGKVLTGPHQVPGGSWIVQFLDPQGAMFAVVAAKK